ncbi:E3 ubiquitin-protein ligase RMA1H1-like [Cucurbita maxima]|uniref:E3 ubiquitin-protein ligase RMA n=1 Tax=Cucurbita maxima TaxID=3661 RepID=A0A6J1HXA9_CUCMA|nr:E3 ubiquitin-protein ligase RMA1H1-like [Cucurbita maxima]XP_022969256.1 E3 ubiquitin-protein ligase RMA1H1-like [Cucurbita maxima]XP_022969257.1 E3 ubiquitin-protein ligase RMA1H1-like [Cucurbita maxima]XP_022969258.1 E3 ubiquitin-protein ligase RMA1H1-like [Cucurbita maxima]
MEINSFGENKSWTSVVDAMADTHGDASGLFDCNICLETVKDPVVTLCGHLFCWPCLYKWLHFQDSSKEKHGRRLQQCPVCKAEVSDATLVPLYGKGGTQDPFESKNSQLGIVVPRRPNGPVCFELPKPASHPTSHPVPQSRQGNSSNQSNICYAQVTGVFGEVVYARMFGAITNLYAYPNAYPLVWSSSPRIRRHILQTDESLNRICIFLFCFLVICLLLF